MKWLDYEYILSKIFLEIFTLYIIHLVLQLDLLDSNFR